MQIIDLTCTKCGGVLNKINDKLMCPFCRTEWLIESENGHDLLKTIDKKIDNLQPWKTTNNKSLANIEYQMARLDLNPTMPNPNRSKTLWKFVIYWAITFCMGGIVIGLPEAVHILLFPISIAYTIFFIGFFVSLFTVPKRIVNQELAYVNRMKYNELNKEANKLKL